MNWIAIIMFTLVSCELGRLYNKDAILHFLLDRGKQPEETQRRLAHIKRMKDVVELKLSPNPSHRVDKSGKKHGAEYHCPISTLEMNGRHKFGFILQTGTGNGDFFYVGQNIVLSSFSY